MHRTPGCLAFSDRTGKSIFPLNCHKSTWAHEAREVARRMVWRQVAKDRRESGDMRGIERGIQREMTMKLYDGENPRVQGILRKILLGAIWTQLRRSKMPGNVDGPRCQNCDLGVEENLTHLWWECPAWAHCRGDVVPSANWPKCVSTCGIIPNGVNIPTRAVERIQSVMVKIFEARYEGFSRNT